MFNDFFAVLKKAGRTVGADLSKIPLILCDCGDSRSLIGETASIFFSF
jgi:hypothetical protein